MSDEARETSVPIIQPRAYQLELFEASMNQNVIITMDTGSGKTQVAKLRIEAELERCSGDKLVWFLAPTVVLAEQQHRYLASQLPAYQSRLICGSDNVEHWSNSAIWNAVLRDMKIVVTTSRILLDALVHGFVQFGRIALLVFDEAHHCMKGHDTNRIMQEFYHNTKSSDTAQARPHILGLTASPITNPKLGVLEKLERNMNAICRCPTRHLEELQRHVHQPQMIKLTFVNTVVTPSQALQKLQRLIDDFDLSQDPYVKYLKTDGGSLSQSRLRTVESTRSTDTLKELKSILRRTTELHHELGNWAATYFLTACGQKLRQKIERYSTMLATLKMEEAVFLYQLLSPVLGETHSVPCSELEDSHISPKAMSLLTYLRNEYTEKTTGIIFVKERSTAAILARLISQHPLTDRYRTEPFVGTSNIARKESVVDLVDINTQNDALADFRSGKNNFLVCTSVLEEGVDISSMNLVIRFYEPANFRAFIQSRGRARMVESKFVLVCAENDEAGSYEKWRKLEAEMKEKYMDEMREIAKQVEDEEPDDMHDEYLSDPTTGACLSIHDAKAHLEHFCACLPTAPYTDPPRPEYILNSLPGSQFSADVVLPRCVNISPRRIAGKYEWPTRKMATKDAAFRAYVRLYDDRLINKNLLPVALPDPVVPEAEAETEEVQSLLCVRDRMNPLTDGCGSRGGRRQQILSIHARVSEEDQLPILYLVLPTVLHASIPFRMFWTKDRHIDVKISPVHQEADLLQDDEFQSLGLRSTHRLLGSVFQGKLQTQKEWPHMFPFLLVPFLETTLLQKWLTECTSCTYTDHFDDLLPEWGLIRLKSWSTATRPYVFLSSTMRARQPEWLHEPTSSPDQAIKEVHFEVKRLPKRLDYLHPPGSEDFNTATELIPAAECYVDGFPTSYAKFMILLPSILHKLELRAVASALSRNFLASVGFESIELVETAICSSAAGESSNYQRLELIGDCILKFWTSAQLCQQFPGWHEGYLSRGKDRVVSNSHLCKAAIDHGLDKYIHTAPFAGSRWRPPTVEPNAGDQVGEPRRDMSSKTIADVVEALIGASFLDGKDEQARVLKVKACLATLLTGLSWRSPAENASTLRDLVPEASNNFKNFDSLAEITGFPFIKRVLLVEALTHPSYPPLGIPGSYQRLEFLGDSILDWLVVQTMARHAHGLSHFTMHLVRAAVVNAHLLAYFCLGASVEQARTEVIDDGTEIRNTKKQTYLWEFMRNSGKVELLQAQKACATRYRELSPAIKAALDHGNSHPWYLLLSLKAEKFFSDIIESMLGAIFIDSNGDLKACEEYLRRLGLLTYLGRVLTENIDVMHPKERLGILAGNAKVRYSTAREVVDDVVEYSCTVSVDDEPAARSTGAVSESAAEAKAAELAAGLISEERSRSTEKTNEEMEPINH